MAYKSLDDRQVIERSALPTSIGSAANTTLDNVLSTIDSVMANLSGTQTLTNKTLGFLKTSVLTDSTTTGNNSTLLSSDILAGTVRLTNGSLVSVSGIPAGASGQYIVVENQTGNGIVINNNDSGATTGNKIYTGTSGNIPMPNNSTFTFVYDSTIGYWLLASGSGSGGSSLAPTITVLVAGDSGTYIPPLGVVRLEVEVIGGGGGGASAIAGGSAGGATTFGVITCNGGAGGGQQNQPPSAGGTVSIGSGPIVVDSYQGGSGGGGGASSPGGINSIGGMGASSPFGGAGGAGGGNSSNGTTGGNATAPGSGGGGGGSGAGGAGGGGGGAAGGYAKVIIATPNAISYSVGSGGSPGSGSGGYASGGSGFGGTIIITEFYGTTSVNSSPNVIVLTGSGTFTPAAGVIELEVFMIGAGAGGNGGGSGAGLGTNGGSTTLGSWTVGGGNVDGGNSGTDPGIGGSAAVLTGALGYSYTGCTAGYGGALN